MKGNSWLLVGAAAFLSLAGAMLAQHVRSVAAERREREDRQVALNFTTRQLGDEATLLQGSDDPYDVDYRLPAIRRGLVMLTNARSGLGDIAPQPLLAAARADGPGKWILSLEWLETGLAVTRVEIAEDGRPTGGGECFRWTNEDRDDLRTTLLRTFRIAVTAANVSVGGSSNPGEPVIHVTSNAISPRARVSLIYGNNLRSPSIGIYTLRADWAPQAAPNRAAPPSTRAAGSARGDPTAKDN
jgi:hypothetical protein